MTTHELPTGPEFAQVRITANLFEADQNALVQKQAAVAELLHNAGIHDVHVEYIAPQSEREQALGTTIQDALHAVEEVNLPLCYRLQVLYAREGVHTLRDVLSIGIHRSQDIRNYGPVMQKLTERVLTTAGLADEWIYVRTPEDVARWCTSLDQVHVYAMYPLLGDDTPKGANFRDHKVADILGMTNYQLLPFVARRFRDLKRDATIFDEDRRRIDDLRATALSFASRFLQAQQANL